MSGPVKMTARLLRLTPAEASALVAAHGPDKAGELCLAPDAILDREIARAVAAPAFYVVDEADPVVAAGQRAGIAGRFLRNIESMLRSHLCAEWREAGGCARCGGRGWIVTWDTMDAMDGGYAEYGACPDHNPGQCADVGLQPTHDKYDRNQGVHDPLEWRERGTAHPWNVAALLRFTETMLPWRVAAATADEELAETRERYRIAKGRTVRVFKGRKVPVGTRGVVIWLGSGTYGERVGVKDAAGVVHWTASANVRVDPSVPEVQQPAQRGPVQYNGARERAIRGSYHRGKRGPSLQKGVDYNDRFGDEG